MMQHLMAAEGWILPQKEGICGIIANFVTKFINHVQ